MKLTFLGANRNVTGSRYCLEAGGSRVMIDCGLVQEREFLARNWEPCPIPADSIDALVVTHAHIDHIGLIPKLVADGFSAPIHATRPTVALADVMLRDSAKIQEEDAKYKKRRHRKEGRRGAHPEVPLYTEQDVARTLPLFRGVDYRSPVEVAAGVTVTWHDAGHILGSASLEIRVKEGDRERTFVFSGDIGQRDKPLIHDPTFFRAADYVVMESTYGDRDHAEQGEVERRLEEIAKRTLARGGNLVIPVFAVERAQEMMFFLSRLVHQDRIPDVPIFLDSPMAYDATNIFRQFEDWMDDQTRALIRSNEPPLHFPGFHMTRTTDESKAINRVTQPCIIMAPAGMCNAGRIKHHLRQNVRRPQSTILFVGFQAKGTLGRHLLSGEKQVRIHGREHPVNAEIEQILGLSGHADRSGLIDWLAHFAQPPRKVFLTHGEEEVALALSREVQDRFGFDVLVPHYGEEHGFDDSGASLVAAGADVVADRKPAAPIPDLPPARAASEPSGGASIRTTSATTTHVRPHPDFELLDSTARRPVDFLDQDPWRALRVQSDMIQGIETMTRALEGRRRAVSVFGSARLPETDPYYQLARETSLRLGRRGFAIITGGGPGIMEAANRGAREAETLSIGLNIDLPHEQSLNPYCDAAYTCHYFFVRKTMFAKYSRGFVILPGGFGTMDELFESLTLIQTGKLARFPVALADREYWQPLIEWLDKTVRVTGCIDGRDLAGFRVFDDPEEIAEWMDRGIDGEPSLH